MAICSREPIIMREREIARSFPYIAREKEGGPITADSAEAKRRTFGEPREGGRGENAFWIR